MKKIIIIIFSLLAFSCASSKNNNPKIDFSKFDFFYIKNADMFNFYFVFNPTYSNLKDTINFEKINLTFTLKNLKDKFQINLESVFEGIHKNAENSFQQIRIYNGKVSMMDLNGMEPEEIRVEAKTNFKKQKFSRKEILSNLLLQPNYAKLEFLKLYPKISTISEEKLELELFAIRVVPHSGEYLPSSEILRTELYNYQTGKKINSSEGRNFLQVITDVEPKVVGDYKVLTSQINISKQLITERNSIKYIIPAVPNNYSVELNFWKDK